MERATCGYESNIQLGIVLHEDLDAISLAIDDFWASK